MERALASLLLLTPEHLVNSVCRHIEPFRDVLDHVKGHFGLFWCHLRVAWPLCNMYDDDM